MIFTIGLLTVVTVPHECENCYISGGFKMGDRKININDGNYNEEIKGDYIQGDKIDNSQVDKSDQSKNFKVGDVGRDFSPTNSPIMSDNAQISSSNGSETEQKGRNWGLIVGIAAIIISVCVGGLFNEEIREFLNLNTPSETPEQIESKPVN